MTIEPRGAGPRGFARVLLSCAALTVFLVVATVRAEDSDSLAWSADRKLAWEDFAGAVAREEGSQRVAATTAAIYWSYDFSVRLAGGVCTYTITDIESAAHFHPDESWVDPAHRNAAVLAHEQGHFDIAEIFSRQFMTVTRELIGTEYPCRAARMGPATRDSGAEIAKRLGEIYDEIWARYRDRQRAYDSDTRHGTDTDAQREWGECIATTLESGPGCWPEAGPPLGSGIE